MWKEMQLQEIKIVQLEELQHKFLKGVQQMELHILKEGQKETA